MLILEKNHEGFSGLQAQNGAPSAPLPVVGSRTNDQVKKKISTTLRRAAMSLSVSWLSSFPTPSTEQFVMLPGN